MPDADSSLSPLMKAATPDLYRRNAFRLTGLPVTATAREVSRQADKLKMLAEVGGHAAQQLTVLPGTEPPTLDEVREAVQKLKELEARAVDEFFWFWPEDWEKPDQDEAFAALKRNDLDAAFNIWTRREVQTEDESGAVIASHNLAVMFHMRALEWTHVDLQHPLSKEDAAHGRVMSSDNTSFSGFTIEFNNDKSGWSSGRAPVHGDGTFTITLSAERKVRNHYRITLRNAIGEAQKATPDTLHYTIGAAVEEQPIIHSIGVGLTNNGVRAYFAKGMGLPQTKMQKFHTTKAVKPGQTESFIRVPVIEGESEFSDRNRLIGWMDLKGTDIRRELPEGQEIEVTLKIDQSREIIVEAFVPYLDEEFRAVLETGRKAFGNKPDVLRERLSQEQKRLEALKNQADEAEDRAANATLGEVDRDDATKELRRKLRDAEGDFVAGEQCDKMLLDLACRLDEVESRLKWPALVKDVQGLGKDLREIAEESGTRQQKDKAEDLQEQADGHIQAKNSERLKKTQEQMLDLYRAILFEQPSFWAGYFRNLEGDVPLMSDATRAQRVVAHGRQSMAENNLQGLRNACIQLAQMLPREVSEQAQRGWQAGII